MDQTTAKEILKETSYLDNRILVFNESKKTQFCKIIWKGYSATSKDDNNEDGTVRVRYKDLLTGKEFTDNLTQIANKFPKKEILTKENSKKEILNVLESNNEVSSKTLEWISDSVDEEVANEQNLETLLTELWLESKVTKARFKSDDTVVYNSRK